ncbi:hypothetical protein N9Z65_00980 [bacterium]|nr:hypothetical protein [bacterium]
MLNSLYIGKVIHDSDFLCEGDTTPQNRVKVFISGITPSDTQDFNQPRGKTNEKVISNQALEATGQEFYAYVMMPVMGSGTGSKYNANTDILSVSDTNSLDDLNAIPPADAYSHVHDNFMGGNAIGTAGVNVTAQAYSADNRSNSYKGMLSKPGVGSTVVVSFLNNQRSMPVVLGILPSVADVKSIHGLGDSAEVYPNYAGAYSNLTSANLTSQTDNINPNLPDNGTTITTSTTATDGTVTTTTTNSESGIPSETTVTDGSETTPGSTSEAIATTTTAPDGTVTTTDPDGTVTISKPDKTVITTTDDGTVTTRTTAPDGTVTTSKTTGSTTNTSTFTGGDVIITKAHEGPPPQYVKRGNATVRVSGGLSQKEAEAAADDLLRRQARSNEQFERRIGASTTRTEQEKAEKIKEVRERGERNRGITYNDS